VAKFGEVKIGIISQLHPVTNLLVGGLEHVLFFQITNQLTKDPNRISYFSEG